MEPHKQKLMQIITEAGIEAGAIPGVPVVEIAGEEQVLIENHRGIISYGNNQISVRMKYGYICIEGQNLTLANLTTHHLIIRGCIDCVQLHGRKGNA